MTQHAPRRQMRELIAAKIATRSSLFNDYPIAGELADAVMEMFPEVDMAREYHGPGYVIPLGRGRGRFGDGATHIRYEMRTSPEPAP